MTMVGFDSLEAEWLNNEPCSLEKEHLFITKVVSLANI